MAIFKPHDPYVCYLRLEPALSCTFLYSNSAVVKWHHTTWKYHMRMRSLSNHRARSTQWVKTHGRDLFSHTCQPTKRKRKETSASREIINYTKIIREINYASVMDTHTCGPSQPHEKMLLLCGRFYSSKLNKDSSSIERFKFLNSLRTALVFKKKVGNSNGPEDIWI